MDFGYWKESLVKWVNVTGIVEENVSDIQDLHDGKFIGQLLGLWKRKSNHGKGISRDDLSACEVAHALKDFLKVEYPHYEFDLDAFQCQSETELVYVTSLLLFHCCLRKMDQTIIKRMSGLPEEEQIVMKTFFERVLPEGNYITQKVLKSAICKEDFGRRRSPITAVSAVFNSPTYSPRNRHILGEFLQSPAAKQQKLLDKQTQEMRRLKMQVDAKNSENTYLQEELQSVQDEVKTLVNRCSELVQENKRLREKPFVIEVEAVNEKDHSKDLEVVKRLRDEISSIEAYATSLREELTVLHDQNEVLTRERNFSENRIKYLHERVALLESHCETLEQTLNARDVETRNLREHIQELTICIQEMKPDNNISIEWDYSDLPTNISPVKELSENLGTAVIDLQLQEMKVENSLVKEELQSVLQSKEELYRKFTTIQSENYELERLTGELKEKVLSFEKTILNLNNERSTLLEENISLQKIQDDTVQSHVAQIHEMEQKLQSLKQILSEREGKITFFSEENATLLKQISELKENESELKNKIGTFENQIKVLEEENIYLYETSEADRIKSETIIGEIKSSLEEKIVNLEIDRKTLMKDNEALQKALEEENLLYSKRILEIEDQLEISKEASFKKSEKIVVLSDEIKTLLSQVSELQEKESLMTDKLKILENLTEDMKVKNKSLTETCEIMRSDNETRIQEIKSSFEEIIERLENEKKTLLEEQVTLHQAHKEINMLHFKEIANMEQKLESYMKNILQKEEQVNKLSQEREILSCKLNKLEEEKNLMMQNLRTSEEQISNLEHEIHLSSQNHESTKLEMQQMKSSLEEKIKDLEKDRRIFLKDNEALQNALDEENLLHSKRILEIEEQLEISKMASLKKDEKIVVLSDKIKTLLDQVLELQEKESVMMDKLRTLDNLTEVMEVENKSLSETCEIMRSDNEARIQEIKSSFEEKVQILENEKKTLLKEQVTLNQAQEETNMLHFKEIANMEQKLESYMNNTFQKEEQINKLSHERENLNCKLNKLKEEKDLMMENLRTYEKQISNFEHESNLASQDYKSIKLEMQQMKSLFEERIRKLDDERKASLKETVSLKKIIEETNELHLKEITEIELKFELSEKHLSDKEQEIMNISKETKILQNQVWKLEEERRAMMDKLDASESQKKDLEEREKSLSAAYEALKIQNETEVLQIKAVHDEKIQKLNEEMKALLEDHLSLQNTQEDSNKLHFTEIARIEQKSEAYLKDILIKKEQITKLSEEMETLHSKLTAIDEEKHVMAEKLRNYEEKIVKLENENIMLSEACKIAEIESEARIQEMKSSLEEINQKLDEERKFFLKEKSALQQTWRDTEQFYLEEAAKIKQQTELYRKDLLLKEQQILSFSEEIKSLHGQISELIDETKLMKYKLASSESQIKDLEEGKKLLNQICEASKNENEERTQHVISSFQEKIQKLNDEIKTLLEEKVTLQKANEEAHTCIATLNSSLEKLNQEFDEERRNFLEEKSALGKSQKDAEQQHLEDIAEIKKQSELCRGDLLLKEQQIVSLSEEISSLHSQISEFEKETSSVLYKITSSESKINVLEEENKLLHQTCEFVKNEIEKKKLAISFFEEKNHKLNDENKTLLEEKGALQKAHKEAHAYLATLKESLTVSEGFCEKVKEYEDGNTFSTKIQELTCEKDDLEKIVYSLKESVVLLYMHIFQKGYSSASCQFDPTVETNEGFEKPKTDTWLKNEKEFDVLCKTNTEDNQDNSQVERVLVGNFNSVVESHAENESNSSEFHIQSVRSSMTEVFSMLSRMFSDIYTFLDDKIEKNIALEYQVQILTEENVKVIEEMKKNQAVKNDEESRSILELKQLKAENIKLADVCEGLKCEMSRLKDQLEKQQCAGGTLKLDLDAQDARNKYLATKLEEWEKIGLRIEEMCSKHIHAKQNYDVKLEQVIADKKQLEDKLRALYGTVRHVTENPKLFEVSPSSEVHSLKVDVDSAMVKVEEGFNKISGDLLDLTRSCLRVMELNMEQQHVLVTSQSKRNSSSLFNNRIEPEGGRRSMNYAPDESDLSLDHNSSLQIQILTIQDKIHSLLNEVESIFDKCQKLEVLFDVTGEPLVKFENLEDSLEMQFNSLKSVENGNMMKGMEIELQKLRKQVNELQSQNRVLRDRSAASDSIVQSLQKSLEDLKIINKNTSDEKEQLVLMKNLLEQRVVEIQKDLQQSSLVGNSNTNEIARITGAYKALIDEKCQIQKKYCDLKMKFLENQNEYHLEKENLKRSITELKAYLQQAESGRVEQIRKQCEEDIRTEYEIKLEKLKMQMRIACSEEVNKVKKRYADHDDLREVCRNYAEKVTKSQADMNEMRSQLWELSSKLLKVQEEKAYLENLLKERDEKVHLAQQRFELEKRALHSKSATDVRIPTESFERLKRPHQYKNPDPNDTMHRAEHVEESVTYVRRRSTSVRMSVPSGDAFPPQDEDGEIFNATYLADLKEGRCQLPDRGRLSQLQFRNSLCPPHLKSSYPAETQYHDPRHFDDEDLKFGCVVIDESEDSLSTSCLLPGDKQRKGRGQGAEIGTTPRSVLREHNESSGSRRGVTPSRLKSLFLSKSSRRDENSPVTPRGRGLSFFRKPTKNRSHPL